MDNEISKDCKYWSSSGFKHGALSLLACLEHPQLGLRILVCGPSMALTFGIIIGRTSTTTSSASRTKTMYADEFRDYQFLRELRVAEGLSHPEQVYNRFE